MHVPHTFGVWRVTALASLLAGLLWLSLSRAQAAGVVTDCTSAGLEGAMAVSGSITFSCGPNPVVITVTHNGGLNAPNGFFYTIDGGNMVTLSGAGVNRLFDVRVGGALTLTNIILTDGFQDGIHGNLPDVGGAILDEGRRLTLDHVTIRNSQSKSYGGGIEIITGTVSVQDSLIEGNQSGWGGGIDNASPISLISTLSLINTTVRANYALTQSGGGLNLVGPVSISNSQIVDNHAVQFGGGIYWTFGTLTVNNSTFSANHAGSAGGIFVNGGGTATLNYSTLNGNSVDVEGGGSFIYNGGTLTLNNSTLNGNRASTGGGIFNYFGATLTLNNSTLSGNSTDSYGGGIYNLGLLTLNKSTLNGNSASAGGGIWTTGIAVLNNSTLSGNTASSGGGGIYNAELVSLWNATVSNNSAPVGGALFMEGSTTTVLTNTILAYSPTGGNCSGSVATAQYSIDSDNTCALMSLDASNVYTNPLLTALGNYGGPTLVHMPKTGSPAIDGVAGNDVPGNLDQRGFGRPVGAYDIGAVERQPDDSDLAPRLFLPALLR